MSDEIDNIPEIPATASPIAPGTTDRNGVPFDPARHLPKAHPRTGRWMPRGGRKPKNALPSSLSTSSPPDHTAATPEGSQPPISSPSPADSPAAPVSPEPPPPSFADIEQAAGPTEPTPSKAPDAKAELVDNVEAQADGAWRAVYALLGIITGAPEETTRSGAAHANNRDALASWMREADFRIKGWKAFAVSAVAYIAETFSRPKSAAKAKGWRAAWFARSGPAQAPKPAPVEAPAAPITPPPTAAVDPSVPTIPDFAK